MTSFSFVHAADLHLDSPFIGVAKLPDEHAHVVCASARRLSRRSRR